MTRFFHSYLQQYFKLSPPILTSLDPRTLIDQEIKFAEYNARAKNFALYQCFVKKQRRLLAFCCKKTGIFASLCFELTHG